MTETSMRRGGSGAAAFVACVAVAAWPAVVSALTVDLHLLFVHGVKTCAASRQNAHHSLVDLAGAVEAAAPARLAAFTAAHPGITVRIHTAAANLYTAGPSGWHPSDSTDPLDMDDWEVGDPGCATTRQGDPCTTAYEWRHRLAAEIDRLFPAPAANVILVGHSTGARTAMEVAANVGPDGAVGGQDWGVQDRIAGVVTLHGMLDAIGTSKYNFVGTTSFETGCKLADPVVFFGDACPPGNGWCEYAGRVDGFPAADWVAWNRRALMLTAWGSCSPSAWTGRSDGSLPYDAQGSPWAVGLDMTPAAGQTHRPSHGERYGAFCHSAITNGGHAQHVAARDAASQRLLDWLFVAAPRTAAAGTNTTPSIGFDQFSAVFPMGAACPAGEVDDTVTTGTKGLGIDVVGVCRHPGFFDGDDHPIAAGELFVTNGSTCNGSYRWQQAHDSNNNHAAELWWKTRSVYDEGPDLVSHVVATALERCGDGALDPGEACDDGNVADGDCCSSTCEPAAAGSACGSDGNECTDDVCDGAGSCAPVPNDAACDDGVFCNGADRCSAAACILHEGDPCAGGAVCNSVCNEAAATCFDPAGAACPSDGNECTDDVCDGEGLCAHEPNAAACDDGLFCNGADTCSGGSCALHAGDPCAGGAECNDSCDEPADSCAAAAGIPCSSDENGCTDDRCDGAGACAHVPNTLPCEDGDACTVGDLCAAGTCEPGPPPDCPRCESCDVELGCVARPQEHCKQPGPEEARLRIRRPGAPERDLFSWTWRRGEATTLAELGFPETTDAYELCVYDESGPAPATVFAAGVPGGDVCGSASCWRRGGRSLTYKDRSRTPEGIDMLRLGAGPTGLSSVLVTGKGAALADRPDGLPTPPLSTPLRVQLRNDVGTCWEARFGAPRKNKPGVFEAKSE